MSRPDMRLLVRAEVLPLVPRGALLWSIDPSGETAWFVLSQDERGLMVCDAEATGTDYDVRLFRMGPTLWVDLSAPERPGRVEVRPDLLTWALRALRCSSRHCAAVMDSMGSVSIEDGERVLRAMDGQVVSEDDLVVSEWPDLRGLTFDEQARAVVAAAFSSRSAS